jgi:membrane-bound lytic murein transglycosylase D
MAVGTNFTVFLNLSQQITMKKKFSGLAIFLAGLLAGCIIIVAIFGFNEIRNIKKPVEKPVTKSYSWSAPPLPATIDFAGENTPLERWEVKEQLDREVLFNYYWQNNILYMMKLSSRYFPLIEERLKAHGVPEDFKYLCIAESNLTNAISRSGAVGFWQFMKGTAPGYNLEVSETVDERYNVLKSTDAACVYFKQAYNKFGSWTAAAASYNCGMGCFQTHSDYQGSKNYYDLILPEETQRYVFRILAFKYLVGKSDSLGFTLSNAELYTPVKTRSVFVRNSIPDLAAFARNNGSTYKMLKWLNPWMRARTLTVKPGKSYEVIFPAE